MVLTPFFTYNSLYHRGSVSDIDSSENGHAAHYSDKMGAEEERGLLEVSDLRGGLDVKTYNGWILPGEIPYD